MRKRNATIEMDGVTVELPGTAEELAAEPRAVGFRVHEYDADGSGRLWRTETFEDAGEAATRVLNLRRQGIEASMMAVYETDERGERLELVAC